MSTFRIYVVRLALNTHLIINSNKTAVDLYDMYENDFFTIKKENWRGDAYAKQSDILYQ